VDVTRTSCSSVRSACTGLDGWLAFAA
jgi:hypothetical protein